MVSKMRVLKLKKEMAALAHYRPSSLVHVEMIKLDDLGMVKVVDKTNGHVYFTGNYAPIAHTCLALRQAGVRGSVRVYHKGKPSHTYDIDALARGIA